MNRFAESDSGLWIPENYEGPWSQRRHFGSAACRGLVSGGFDPTKLSGLEAYFLAHQGWTASQWNDLSGRGNHLTQGNATQQPTLATNWSGGLPAVQFDGINDSMFRSTLAGGTIAQQTTIVVVFETAGPASPAAVVDSRDGANRQLVADSSTFIGHYAGSYCQASRTFSTPEKVIFTGVFNGASSSCRVRRSGLSTLTQSGTTGSGSLNGLTVGNAFNDGAGLAGKIAALCVLRRGLAAAEQLLLEGFFTSLYRFT